MIIVDVLNPENNENDDDTKDPQKTCRLELDEIKRKSLGLQLQVISIDGKIISEDT